MGLYDGLDSAIPYAAMGVPSVSNATKQMQGLREMRAIDMANRVYGGPRAPRQSGGNNPFFSAPGAGADYSAFTYDPAMRAQAQSAGVNPLSPDQVNPNAVLPNGGFFGAHPMLSRGIEGAMFGAANTRGANTLGEGISNVTQGIIGGQQMRGQMLERQFQAPFQDAAALQGIKHASLVNQNDEAEIALRRAQTDKILNAPDPMPKYNSHIPAADGSVWGLRQDGGQPEQVLPPGTIAPKNSPTPHDPGIAPYTPYAKSHGWDVDTMTPKQWQQVKKEKFNDDVRLAGSKKAADINAGDSTPTPNKDKQKDVLAARKWIGSRPVGYFLDKKLADGTKIRSGDTAKQLQYYKENINSINADSLDEGEDPPSANPYRH